MTRTPTLIRETQKRHRVFHMTRLNPNSTVSSARNPNTAVTSIQGLDNMSHKHVDVITKDATQRLLKLHRSGTPSIKRTEPIVSNVHRLWNCFTNEEAFPRP